MRIEQKTHMQAVGRKGAEPDSQGSSAICGRQPVAPAGLEPVAKRVGISRRMTVRANTIPAMSPGRAISFPKNVPLPRGDDRNLTRSVPGRRLRSSRPSRGMPAGVSRAVGCKVAHAMCRPDRGSMPDHSLPDSQLDELGIQLASLVMRNRTQKLLSRVHWELCRIDG